MTTATANTAPAVSDSANESISLDDAASLDFRDPLEEDNKDVWRPGPQGEKEDKSDSLEKGAESLKPDDDEGDEPTAAEEPEANEADKPEEPTDPDLASILLKGGEQVSLGELKLGYMREKDYRHKTMAIGNKTKALESSAARVLRTVDTIAGFLAQQLPEEPPRHLAMSDPGEYTRRKAMFDSGMEQVQSILALAADPQAVTGELTREQTEEKLADENAALVEAFPELEKPDMRNKFFADAFKAGEELGFTADEMREFNDHRYFKFAYWAMKGLQAEQAKEQAERAKANALEKVNNAPPLVAKTKPAGKPAGNRDAMRKLTSTGSLKDALSIDF